MAEKERKRRPKKEAEDPKEKEESKDEKPKKPRRKNAFAPEKITEILDSFYKDKKSMTEIKTTYSISIKILKGLIADYGQEYCKINNITYNSGEPMSPQEYAQWLQNNKK